MSSSHIINIEKNGSEITSVLYLKILLLLSYGNGSIYFKDLQTYLGKSKSQISVALKKLENSNLILRSNTRPQNLSITKKGRKAKSDTLRNILKFKRYLKQPSSKPGNSSIHKKKRAPSTHNLNNKKDIIEKNKKEQVIEKLIKETNDIIKGELNEYFGNKVPPEILSDIRLEIKNKIHDKMYQYL